MIEANDRALATCEQCHKRYRIPNRSHTYECEACGGTVRSQPTMRRRSLLASMIACPTCGALNRHDAATCNECSNSLDEETVREIAALKRHEINHALKGAGKLVSAVSILYRLGALSYAIATAFAIFALADLEVPREPGMLVVGMMTTMSVLMLMGALHILFKPFVWTLIIAVLGTAITVVHWYGPNPLGLAAFASAAWSLVAWAALVPTSRFSRLIDEHKDLYILHHASGDTRRSLKDRTPEERHERLVRAMRRAGWRAWKTSVAAAAVLILLSTLGTYRIVGTVRPQELNAALSAFESAWNDSDLAAATAFLPSESRAEKLRRLRGVTAGHGWATALPPLEEADSRRDGQRAWRDYRAGGLTLQTSWFLDGQVWRMLELQLPVPPLEPHVEAVLAAWRNSDAAAIAAFFSEESREVMLESIEEAVATREWTSYPEIRESKLTDYASGGATQSILVPKGKATLNWNLRPDGTWGLQSLKFPTHIIRIPKEGGEAAGD